MKRTIIAISLLVLFVAPQLTKTSHFLLSKHEHHHFHLHDRHASTSYEIHHEKCPFFQLDFVEFYKETPYTATHSTPCTREIQIPEILSVFISNPDQSFMLRAPPLS